MLRLYFIPGRSWLPRWLLEELEQPYELVELDREASEHKAAGYLKINSLGKAPALLVNGHAMTETAAICLYLADRFGQGRFAPPLDDDQRPRYLSLMVHASAALDPALSVRLFDRDMPPEQVGWGTIEDEFAFVEGHLGKGPLLFGDTFSAADVMIGGTLIWAGLTGAKLPGTLQAYTQLLMQRPKLAKLFEEAGGVSDAPA